MKIAAISSKAYGAPNNNYLYQGDFAEFDDPADGGAGWEDFMLRSYDPQLGRFLQADPYDQFASPYVGMGNDPVNMIDPNGGGAGFITAAANAADASGNYNAVVTFSKLASPQIFSNIVTKTSLAANAANSFTRGSQIFTQPLNDNTSHVINIPPQGNPKNQQPDVTTTTIGPSKEMNLLEKQQHAENRARLWDDAGYNANGDPKPSTKFAEWYNNTRFDNIPIVKAATWTGYIYTGREVVLGAKTAYLAIKAGLKLESSVASVLGSTYKLMGEVSVDIKNADLLKKLNATSDGNWVKVYEAGILDGKKVEIHFFRNNNTGEVFDVKTKYEYWHQKQFKKLGQ